MKAAMLTRPASILTAAALTLGGVVSGGLAAAAA